MNMALTEPEITVFNWLTKNKISFLPQQNIYGGATEPGGARVDFYLYELNLVIRVQSYWHTLTETKARDIIQKAALMNSGYTVIDVWEEDLKVNAEVVMKMALRGEEKSHPL